MVGTAYLPRVDTSVRLAAATYFVPASFLRKIVLFAGHTGAADVLNRLQQQPRGDGYRVGIVNMPFR